MVLGERRSRVQEENDGRDCDAHADDACGDGVRDARALGAYAVKVARAQRFSDADQEATNRGTHELPGIPISGRSSP